MGLQEFLKRAWAQITGHDPEGDFGLYRMETADVGLPSDGDVHHKITAHSPVQTPPGVVYYKDVNGELAWKYERATDGLQYVEARLLSPTSTSNQSFYLKSANMSPYASNGAAFYSNTVAMVPMLAKSISITAQADGSVTSAQLLASAGAGDKWTIYYMSLGCGDLAVAGQGKQLTISDGIGYVSATGCVMGPIIQATAATAINYEAAAGMFGNAEVMTLNIQYRESA